MLLGATSSSLGALAGVLTVVDSWPLPLTLLLEATPVTLTKKPLPGQAAPATLLHVTMAFWPVVTA